MSECKSVSDCDQACREKDCNQHKRLCRLSRPLDAVDSFIRACNAKTKPSDNDVAKAFGFCFFMSGVDRPRLFKLYCTLINQWGVSEEELVEAWKSDKLKKLIQFRGSQVPCARTRNEVLWLLEQKGFSAGVMTSWATVFETQRHMLSPLDRTLQWHTLEPREKLESYVFWSQTLNGMMPNVDEDNGIYLGFCTTPNASRTERHTQLYGLLIKKATFEEFWKARRSSNGRAVPEARPG